MTTLTHADHLHHLTHALSLARQSPPKPTNFRVGALILSLRTFPPTIISTGYTLELPGNTHAEQCALAKIDQDADLASLLKTDQTCVLYTTLEPCGKRLSGNVSCVQRIVDTRVGDPKAGIRKVIFGAKEPGTFVQDSRSCQMLDEAGVEWEYVDDLETEILEVAMEGHVKKGDVVADATTGEETKRGTNVDDISAQERKRQEAQPRNPKKRMMEVDIGS